MKSGTTTSLPGLSIDLGRSTDIEDLRRIEIEAGELFRSIGLDSIASMEPTEAETFEEAIDQDHLWVARVETEVAGFAMAIAHGSDLHLEEMSVSPTFGKRGIGRRLLEATTEGARSESFARVTLTTFLEVPWNAPFYRRFGFRVLPDEQLNDHLRQIRSEEREIGLDVRERVCMALEAEPIEELLDL